MRSIEQILDTIDTSNLHNFDRTNFLIYANYMFSTIKTPPPNVKCEDYYRTLYKHIEKLYIRSSL
jgi:hypothetical protein